ncbi:uncharacterized protein [Physcomitrium patens]|uniref:PhnB-like domain-containing protein n=1 Tax=Physcomitrium patens TaxID=3218 RepID=A9T544_PHYPA|nr:uncharacterized protein LOC112273297 [Physcomitrium patens]PNR33084.1 hypothetical protein PHYPA_025027 [Physcomitrium patens]|eukprot:XP_024357669.1 uncharacterized protein LOC112273297 [Physcomitrella patens]
MSKITPCLWFDHGKAEEAAAFYVALLPDSRIDKIVHAPADNPSTPSGAVLLVKFTLAGRPFLGLNGGPTFKFTEAVSFTIDCDDQAEIDHLWDALIEGGGSPSDCGWLKDRYGLSWQIVPKVLPELMSNSDSEKVARVFQTMMTMQKLDIEKLKAA